GLVTMARNLTADGIFARTALLEVDDTLQGIRTGLEILHGVFFHPNIVYLPVMPDMDERALQFVLDHAVENEMGVILFARHPVAGMGREKLVNVWIREQSPDWEVGLRLSNLDLNLLLGYQLVRNWQGQMTLITLVSDESEKQKGEAFLSTLIEYGRMPRSTRAVVEVARLDDYLPRAPQADLHIFGLQERVDMKFMERMVAATGASCIFVRSSGHESALA
ncbi:MAG: Na-K-Cl cotransporter, partial [Chloroflexi bacterium]